MNELKTPEHYMWRTRECYEIQEDMTAGSFGWTAYAIANIIKYLYRYPLKGGADDLRKAQRYLKLLIEHDYPMMKEEEEETNAYTGVAMPEMRVPERDADIGGASNPAPTAEMLRSIYGQDAQRLRGEIADWESHWNSHETELKTEIERLQKKLWEVAPMCCHDCGEVHVRIDEDGCCAYCGGRTYQGIEKRIGEES